MGESVPVEAEVLRSAVQMFLGGSTNDISLNLNPRRVGLVFDFFGDACPWSVRIL
jgi:hypothetical protein